MPTHAADLATTDVALLRRIYHGEDLDASSLSTASLRHLAARAMASNGTRKTVLAEGLEWYRQEPIPFSAQELPTWPSGVFPPVLEEYVRAVAESLQVPTDLPAMLALGVLSVTCQRRIRVHLGSDWEEPTNLYLMPVLGPGERKSATMAEVSQPILEWQKEEVARMAPIVAAESAEVDILTKRLEALKAAAAKAAPEERAGLESLVRDLATDLAARTLLVPPRLLASDATPESLSSLLTLHDGRMGVLDAEPVLLSILAGRYSDGRANLDLFLKAHAGDEIFVDRRGRVENVHRPALTLALCAQPEAMQGFMSRETVGRGAVARFLVSWPVSNVGWRDTGPRPIPFTVRDSYRRLVRRLLDLPGEEVRTLYLGADSCPVWMSFLEEVEEALRPGGAMEHVKDWGGKLAGAVGRIAALLHMTAYAWEESPWSIPIGPGTLGMAMAIGRYCIPHAIHGYGQMGGSESRDLAQKILVTIRRLGQSLITKRDLWQKLKGRGMEASDLDAPMAMLEDRGFIRRIPSRGGSGRQKQEHEVHPSILSLRPNPPIPPNALEWLGCEVPGNGTVPPIVPHLPPNQVGDHAEQPREVREW